NVLSQDSTDKDLLDLADRVRQGEIRHDPFLSAAVFLGHTDIQGNVDEAAGEVSGVCRLEGGIHQTLSSTVGGDEVLGYAEPFTEVRLDREIKHTSGRADEQSSHGCQLAHLVDLASRSGGCHHVHRVERTEVVAHRLGQVLRCLVPDAGDFQILLCFRDDTAL